MMMAFEAYAAQEMLSVVEAVVRDPCYVTSSALVSFEMVPGLQWPSQASRLSSTKYIQFVHQKTAANAED